VELRERQHDLGIGLGAGREAELLDDPGRVEPNAPEIRQDGADDLRSHRPDEGKRGHLPADYHEDRGRFSAASKTLGGASATPRTARLDSAKRTAIRSPMRRRSRSEA
jgi:hypothetical protein